MFQWLSRYRRILFDDDRKRSSDLATLRRLPRPGPHSSTHRCDPSFDLTSSAASSSIPFDPQPTAGYDPPYAADSDLPETSTTSYYNYPSITFDLNRFIISDDDDYE